jgi:hypothetical protein
MPNMMVIGLGIGDIGRDNGPCRRWRIADSSGGYHVEEDGASVGKSRIYIIRGLLEAVAKSDDSGGLVGMLMSSSKNILIWLEAGLRLGDEERTARPCAGVIGVITRVIWEGENIGESDSLSSSVTNEWLDEG